MQNCDYCGAEIPVHARFCGICGCISGDAPKSMTRIMNPTRLNQPPSDTPPLFNSSSYPSLEGAPSISQGADTTIKNSWSEKEEFNLQSWQNVESQSDENQTVWFDGMVPFAAGGLGQFQAG